jgi:osmoprotectant transport system permease protein
MAEPSWIAYVVDRAPELWLRTLQHLMLTGVSTCAAVLIGVPLGIVASRVRSIRGAILGAAGILQTVPSLAMLVLLLALLHKIGVLPAIIALTLYALLPIVRNTVTGLEGVPPRVLEAARGIGMTGLQEMRLVRLPLAIPVIVAGVRTAAVTAVGIATLSAFIGAGGLGQFINQGLAHADTRLILLGAVPAAILALLVDQAVAGAQWALDPRRGGRIRTAGRKALRGAALVLPVFLFGAGAAGYVGSRPDVTIGSKNFTEQIVLGEMLAQLIEARTDLTVDRLFCLGGTMICHGALVHGQIDLYVEYTGTGLMTVLHHDALSDPDEVYRIVSEEYRRRFGVEWCAPLGFNNGYAFTVRRKDARRHGWKTISDLRSAAPQLRIGFPAEFAQRPDGYPGFKKAYGFGFGEVRELDPGLMYDAIAAGEVDVIPAFTTDGRIAAYDLVPLVDDRHFFPPYYAAPVVRLQTLHRYPQLKGVLDLLAGKLDDATMQRLNFEVDQKKRRPAEVARQFLRSEGLLGKQ